MRSAITIKTTSTINTATIKDNNNENNTSPKNRVEHEMEKTPKKYNTRNKNK